MVSRCITISKPQPAPAASGAGQIAAHLAALINGAHACAISGDRRGALDAVGRALQLPPRRAAEFDALATVLTLCDEPARALPLHAQAVSMAPNDPALLYNLATAQRMNGCFAAAEHTADTVIRLRPDDAEAFYLRSDLRRQTPANHHVAELQQRIALSLTTAPPTPAHATAPRHAQRHAPLYFALAKELDDLADYPRAFAALRAGNDLRRAAFAYDVERDMLTMDHLLQRHDATSLQAAADGCDSDEPIFVVGLPRSGTTLVERILGSHGDVQAAGELNAFAQEAVNQVRRRFAGDFSKEAFVERSLDLAPRMLGRAYLDATRPRTGAKPRFVDKTPLNYLYLGLIRRALPRAKIILVRRQPMDSCFAMYRTLFAGAYPFSYDLKELGKYYCAWARLMRHWQHILGPALHVVDYERLVQDQRGETARLLAFCGLDWQDACLSFQDNPGAVTTASASQVRQPLYASSLNRSARYASQLTPLADILRGANAL
jgi:tetratricopeptide (TPR) repeat protein